MLFGDADVEGAIGEGLLENVEPGAGRHGGGDGDDLVVAARASFTSASAKTRV